MLQFHLALKERVLVVDGEKSFRRRSQNALKEHGYNVVTAGNGANALKKLQSEPIDLIVVDTLLPDGGGFRYLQKFMRVNRKVKIVVQTSSPTYSTNFNSWVADAVLMKSDDLSELTETVDFVLHSGERPLN